MTDKSKSSMCDKLRASKHNPPGFKAFDIMGKTEPSTLRAPASLESLFHGSV